VKSSATKRILVGLSGGVDSSVAAARLVKAGHEVVGAFIKTWQPDGVPCNWREERRSAMRAAAHLRIPFITVDLSEIYKREVIDEMLAAYASGLVPNPDVLCNQRVKFGAFLAFARAHGFDAIATGHYVRKRTIKGLHRLFRAVDTEKDQSYFLWTLTQDVLASVEFPIGNTKKSSIREEARTLGLPTATKKDSQGLCFIGPLDVHEFLRRELRTTPGKIRNERGEIIGEHDGAALYAIGQRQHLRIAPRASTSTPYYVVAKDIRTNTLVVSPITPANRTQGGMKTLRLSNVGEVFPGALAATAGLLLQTRYHGPLTNIKTLRIKNADARITLQDPLFDISPGQSAVMYSGNELLGGGIIIDPNRSRIAHFTAS
jgi:tRNA-specific 2-thiouridylase